MPPTGAGAGAASRPLILHSVRANAAVGRSWVSLGRRLGRRVSMLLQWSGPSGACRGRVASLRFLRLRLVVVSSTGGTEAHKE
jgi:hypothetical protein